MNVYVCKEGGHRVRGGRVRTPPLLEGASPHTCATSHSSMANSC